MRHVFYRTPNEQLTLEHEAGRTIIHRMLFFPNGLKFYDEMTDPLEKSLALKDARLDVAIQLLVKEEHKVPCNDLRDLLDRLTVESLLI